MGDKIKNLLCVPGGEIGVKETLAYTMGNFAKSMIYAMSNIYLMIFYTDVLRVDSRQIAVMFLVAKIFDAINDFAMGAIVDRTRTRFGKIRPYILLSAIPIALTTVLIFSSPDFSESGKIIYMYVTYILWGVAYTICDVPYSGLATVMTPSNEERTRLITIINTLGAVSYTFPFLLVPFLMDLKNKNIAPIIAGDSGRVYSSSAIIFAVLGAICLLICFAGTKERVPQNDKKPSFKEILSFLFQNKPLLLLMLCNLLAFPRSLQAMAQTYVATYLLGGGEKMLLLGVPLVLGQLVGILLVPLYTKKFGYVKTYITHIVLSMIPFTIEFFIGFENIAALMIFSFLFTMTTSPVTVIGGLLVADCVDYMEWKKGHRTEGVSYSLTTFIGKVVAALQAFVIGILLAAFHYVEPQMINNVLVEQVQSPATQRGIWAMYTIIPSLGVILSIIPMLFYPLKDSKMTKIREELKARRAK